MLWRIIIFLTCVYAMAVAMPAEELSRVRRFQEGAPPVRLPSGGNSNNGGWKVGAERLPSGGTRVGVDANRRVESQDGKIRGEVHGSYGHVVGGPNRGHTDKTYGGSVSGRW